MLKKIIVETFKEGFELYADAYSKIEGLGEYSTSVKKKAAK